MSGCATATRSGTRGEAGAVADLLESHTGDRWVITECGDHYHVTESHMVADPPERRRATYLSPPELMRLDLWAQCFQAFNGTPYLVGSVLERADFRDVDVRVRVPDDHPVMADPHLLGLLHVAVSSWGEQMTGLRVDCQFQTRQEFTGFDGAPRNPLGLRWAASER